MTALTALYPTPRALAEKLLDGIDFDAVQTVLEPSAGKGDLDRLGRARLHREGLSRGHPRWGNRLAAAGSSC